MRRLQVRSVARLADGRPGVVGQPSRDADPGHAGVNCFDGAPVFEPEDVRIALAINESVPIVMCDARDRDSVKKVLISLVRYVMNTRSQPSPVS